MSIAGPTKANVSEAPARPLHIAYLVNQYPAVSHSFIRREILALEAQGVAVQRISLRGWNGSLADPLDELERERTRFVLQHGFRRLLGAVAATALTRPKALLAALVQATRLAKGSDRSLGFHWIYLAEACVVARWLRDGGVKHVHAHFGTNSTEVALLAALLADSSYSFTVHGPDEFDRPRAIGLGEKIRRAAFVVAITSFTRSQLFRWVERSHWEKIHVVHCGLEPAFHSMPAVGVPDGKRLVCVGRLSEQKGHLLLLAAMRAAFDRGCRFDLVLAGDGELRKALEQRIDELGLRPNVRITGWISSSEVRKELLAARALVLPSFAEGLPVVIMEAMALRRPVIATYVAGIPELVIPGEVGWLVAAGDADALTDAIADCLAESSAMLDRMGERARQRVLARHDIDVEAAKIARLFRLQAQALSGRKPGAA